MPTIAALIADHIGELIHPGDGNSGPIVLPVSTFRTAGIPPEMAEQFAREAGYPTADIPKLVGEAIVHLIETQGDSEIISRGELAQLRAAAKANEPLKDRPVEVHCHCGAELFTAHLRNFSTKPSLHGPTLIKAVRTLGVECATAHQTGT